MDECAGPLGAISVAPENDALVGKGGSTRPPIQVFSLGSGPLLLRRKIVVSDAHALGGAFAVIRVGLVEMADLTLDDLDRNALHRFGDVIHQPLLRFLANQAEQIARLAIIVIAVAMVVTRGVTRPNFDYILN
jgi:hypothetical protein